MMYPQKHIGIIGFGRFGRLLAKVLQPYGKIKVHDKAYLKENPSFNKDSHFTLTTLVEVVQSDILFLLVPISEFEHCCQAILPFLKPKTLVVDCCSVKIYPVSVMQRIFSQEQPIIATHPLFGPDSVEHSGMLRGHKIVICMEQCPKPKQEMLLDIFKSLGLKIYLSTPEEHDQQMAYSQSLAHFIGRGLSALDLKDQKLATPDFQALLNINHRVVHDTWQLFMDMHQYNPFAKQVREKFIQQLITLNEEMRAGNEEIYASPVKPSHQSLELLRKEVDEIDAEMIKKLAAREKIVRKIGQIKAQSGKKILDSSREEQLMKRYEMLSEQYALDAEFIKTLFENIIAHARLIQK